MKKYYFKILKIRDKKHFSKNNYCIKTEKISLKVQKNATTS